MTSVVNVQMSMLSISDYSLHKPAFVRPWHYWLFYGADRF